MNEIIKSDRMYFDWLKTIKRRYSSSQIKSAVQVNREMLLFYWSLGRDIVSLESEKKWGTSFYRTLSNDLSDVLPGVKGLSMKNLYYIKRFYLLVEDAKNIPQPFDKADESTGQPIFPQVVGKIAEPLFSIPWGHIRLIIDKYGNDSERALFYAKKTIENNWSRNVLLNFLDTRLYERQGKAVSNFQLTLPKPQSDLAQEITHDPYVFDFIAVREQYDEKELKDALMNNIQRFFLELGNGFAMLGREYRLVVGETEQFLDFLFYHAKLHCYIVIEVKTRKLEAGDMGQLGTYVAAVNGMLKQKDDAPTIGLLICKTKDNVMAQYAFSAINVPIGISEYKLTDLVPESFNGSLPTIEEIEAELNAGSDTGCNGKTTEEASCKG